MLYKHCLIIRIRKRKQWLSLISEWFQYQNQTILCRNRSLGFSLEMTDIVHRRKHLWIYMYAINQNFVKINEQKWRFHHNRCPQSSKYTMRTSNQFYLILHSQRTSKILSLDQFIASFFSAMVLRIINSILLAYFSSPLKLIKLFYII